MDKCQGCGRWFHLRMLDSKPISLARVQTTTEMISAAADRGEDFNIFQCKDCYGPAWTEAENVYHG